TRPRPGTGNTGRNRPQARRDIGPAAISRRERSMQVPTHIRWPTTQEWDIVTEDFRGTLPLRQRVFITNGLGGDNAPFTIPTSAISPLTVPTLISTALMGLITSKTGAVGDVVNKIVNVTGFLPGPALLSRAASVVNAAYVISVGPSAYPNLASGTY